MQDQKILIIDDELRMRELLAKALRQEGAQVMTASNGRAGLRILYEEKPDLILLDVLMPVLNGWETCERIRRVTDTPIIMVSVLDDEESQLRGYRLGVDDYVTKPFSLELLKARIQTRLRWSAAGVDQATRLTCGRWLSVDPGLRKVWLANSEIHLTATEYSLLLFLLRHPNMVVTAEEIQAEVWGQSGDGRKESPRNVYVLVSRLRKKIEPDPARPVNLLTEYGIGYRLRCDSD